MLYACLTTCENEVVRCRSIERACNCGSHCTSSAGSVLCMAIGLDDGEAEPVHVSYHDCRQILWRHQSSEAWPSFTLCLRDILGLRGQLPAHSYLQDCSHICECVMLVLVIRCRLDVSGSDQQTRTERRPCGGRCCAGMQRHDILVLDMLSSCWTRPSFRLLPSTLLKLEVAV